MLSTSSNIKCPKCGGTGELPDPVQIGRELKAKRLARGITLEIMGKRLGICQSYVSHLEHGRKLWTPRRIAAYLQTLKGKR